MGTDNRAQIPSENQHRPASTLIALLDAARLRVLRATTVIGLLISFGNLVGAIAGFTPSGHVAKLAPWLGAAWCVLWGLAVLYPRVTAACFVRWRPTAVLLGVATALTVGVTAGIDSPLPAVTMYAGWIASVVVVPRAAMGVAFAVSGSIILGYLLAGDSVGDILAGPHRYGAVTSVVLPLATAIVGVLLAAVTNTIFSRLGDTLVGMRAGMLATTPGLTALLAGRPVLELPAVPTRQQRRSAAGAPLTETERMVVQLLAEGYYAKQIAHMRGITLGTVRSHIKRAKAKTGAKTLGELALYTDA